MNPLSNNPVYDVSLSYQKTAALSAAISLDIFTIIGGNRLSAKQIAQACDGALRGVRILCDFLCVTGLMEKNDDLYHLPDDARRFLDRSSPACLADIMNFFAAPETITQVMSDPVSYVKAGGASGLTNVSSDNPVWVKFALAMVPFSSVEAKRTAAYMAKRGIKPRHILDVAAGHGLFGIEAAKSSPDTFVTAIDWANVLEIARKNASAASLSGRYKTISGNAFDVEWGTGYDVILLPNILHHFNPDGCVRLLAKAKESLCEGGCVMIIEMIPNPDRISPPEPAVFAFLMLATTPEGDAYTAGEYEEMARKAGFIPVNATRLLPTPVTLLEFKV